MYLSFPGIEITPLCFLNTFEQDRVAATKWSISMEISVVFFASNQTSLLKAELFIFKLSEDESLPRLSHLFHVAVVLCFIRASHRKWELGCGTDHAVIEYPELEGTLMDHGDHQHHTCH